MLFPLKEKEKAFSFHNACKFCICSVRKNTEPAAGLAPKRPKICVGKEDQRRGGNPLQICPKKGEIMFHFVSVGPRAEGTVF